MVRAGHLCGHLSRVRLALVLAALVWSCTVLAAAPQPESRNPGWAQLSAQQKDVLAPLSGEWDKLEPARKRKWLGIAKGYPKMTLPERERAQARMREWVRLSPQQRREAREKYRRIGKLPPEKRQVLSEKWAEYQALPPEQREAQAAPAAKPRAAKRRAKDSKTTAE